MDTVTRVVELPRGRSIHVRDLKNKEDRLLNGKSEAVVGPRLRKFLLDKVKDPEARAMINDFPHGVLCECARCFFVCSRPEGFPQGETLEEAWFDAPAGQIVGVPDWWFEVRQDIAEHGDLGTLTAEQEGN